MSLNYPTSPLEVFGCLRKHRSLIFELVKRDFIGRYRGSYIGIAWSLFNPLFMLVVYTLVFSIAFQARWGGGDETNNISFSMVLFSGMIVHGFLAECLNKAPTLIVSQPNFVKKVIFPLEILPWVTVISAALHFLIGLFLLIAFCVVSGVELRLTVFLVPIIMLPLMLICLGLTWLFAALAVYLRDIAQIMGVVTTVLLFISPVFYSADSLPLNFKRLLALNPITLPIELLRNAVLWGNPTLWAAWGLSLILGCVTAWIGFYWFQKSRKGFADVL